MIMSHIIRAIWKSHSQASLLLCSLSKTHSPQQWVRKHHKCRKPQNVNISVREKEIWQSLHMWERGWRRHFQFEKERDEGGGTCFAVCNWLGEEGCQQVEGHCSLWWDYLHFSPLEAQVTSGGAIHAYTTDLALSLSCSVSCNCSCSVIRAKAWRPNTLAESPLKSLKAKVSNGTQRTISQFYTLLTLFCYKPFFLLNFPFI